MTRIYPDFYGQRHVTGHIFKTRLLIEHWGRKHQKNSSRGRNQKLVTSEFLAALLIATCQMRNIPKLNQTAKKRFFVGYIKISKVYRIYIPSNRKIVVR